MLITSINPLDQTDTNIDHLLLKVHGLDAGKREEHRFETAGIDGGKLQFWMAGWPWIKEAAPP